MFKNSLSPLRIYAGAAATLLILLVSMCLSLLRFRQMQSANYWNVHTYEVLLATSNIMRGLVNIQSGARGYLQTGDEDFLDSFRAGREEFRKYHAQAASGTRDSEVQQKRFALLHRQYSNWMSGHIDPLIRIRRGSPNFSVAFARAGGEKGANERHKVMEAMGGTVETIEKQERTLLAQRVKNEQNQQRLTQLTLFANGMLALILATWLSTSLAGRSRQLSSVNQSLTEQIQQREKAENEAKMLGEHYEMLLQATNDAITGVDQAGNTTFFNAAAEILTGYKASEVIGKSAHDLLHSHYPDGSPYPVDECPIQATVRDGQTRTSSEEVFWHKDGTPIFIEFTASPLRTEVDEWNEYNQDGKQLGAVVVFRDIGSRKKTEAALQELAAIVNYSEDAIISFDLKGVITSWNRGAMNVYGFSPPEMIGHNFKELIPPDMPNEMPALLEKIREHRPVKRFETTRLRKGGTRIQVVLSLSPILDANSEVIGVASISRETYQTYQERTAQNAATATNNDNSHDGNGSHNM